MKKKIYPKSRILATSQVRSKLYSFVEDIITSAVEDSLANLASVDIPEYDASWCPADYVASRKEEVALEKAKKAYIDALIDSLLINAPEDIKSATQIQGSSDEWTYLSSKSVPDSDGFYTDYTLYTNLDRSKFICMFGDNDLYEPDEDYADFETESEDQAWEWFNSYEGFTDEDDHWMDDIMSSTSNNYWYFTTHGVMPGSVPKGINILDIKDTPNGSFFLTDSVIKTADLERFDIKERKPQDVKGSSFGTDNGLGDFVLTTKTWPEMIKALRDKGLSVDSAYRRRPEEYVSLIQNEKSPESKKYWIARVTQYFNGDYEIRSDNIFRDSYYDE